MGGLVAGTVGDGGGGTATAAVDAAVDGGALVGPGKGSGAVVTVAPPAGSAGRFAGGLPAGPAPGFGREGFVVTLTRAAGVTAAVAVLRAPATGCPSAIRPASAKVTDTASPPTNIRAPDAA